PTIRDATLRVDRREIEPDRDVARLEREIDAERGQDAAPDVVARRVVSKEREVTRSAPRRDAVADRLVQTERRTPCERVQVGWRGSFQLGRPARLERQPAQAV